ncbi:Mitochondrial inner membrane protease subunit 2 [Holothuria leucospilota]|uniref:Mitochondrial inner membrane protease subunit 2 n=1 Tax=Holothuria leucospilota TaxID=206669 RepID=A0A9Q1HJI4_HOLLE|nr:Mitochondrial inner membrane protease subunit 2 [Holothuria leucospilota]
MTSNTSRSLAKLFCGTYFIGVAGSVTFFDKVGYLATVDGRSMQPVFNPKKSKWRDIIFCNRWFVQRHKIEKGDIVSLVSPNHPNEVLVKRVIALEGETIRTLNYKMRHVTIPKGHCWIEGDNHEQSLDSNFFGPVTVGLIHSKATHIIWPLHRIQRLKSELPAGRTVLDRRKVDELLDKEELLEEVE